MQSSVFYSLRRLWDRFGKTEARGEEVGNSNSALGGRGGLGRGAARRDKAAGRAEREAAFLRGQTSHVWRD